eukprot:1088449-Pelagomonas_calceolata.AAC.1
MSVPRRLQVGGQTCSRDLCVVGTMGTMRMLTRGWLTAGCCIRQPVCSSKPWVCASFFARSVAGATRWGDACAGACKANALLVHVLTHARPCCPIL